MSPIGNQQKKEIRNNSIRIYINTLIPYFQFKNRFGIIEMPINRCIAI